MKLYCSQDMFFCFFLWLASIEMEVFGEWGAQKMHAQKIV